MPRRATGTWKQGRYYAKIGETSAATGKSKQTALLYENETPVRFGDLDGVEAAIVRLKVKRNESVKHPMAPTVREVCEQFLRW